MILRLVAIALFNLPKAIILPSEYVVRIGFERALVPNLRELVVAELAIGIADQVGHIREIIMGECLELRDRAGIIVAVVDRRISLAVTLGKGGIVEERLLAGLLFDGAGRFVARRRRRRGRGRRARRVLSRTAAAAATPGGTRGNDRWCRDERRQKHGQCRKSDCRIDHACLLFILKWRSPQLEG